MKPEKTSTVPRVVLGITGSISAYRAADLVSSLTQDGIAVDVILTREGARFITPLTLEALSHWPVFLEDAVDPATGRPTHISLADQADLVVVAPATAQIIGLYANGLAPDLLSATLLATAAPVLFAPAMNGKMWLHPAVQGNVDTLSARGVMWIGPDEGMLSCGYEGIGRLWPVPAIFEEIRRLVRAGSSSSISSHADRARGRRLVAAAGRRKAGERRR